MANITAAMVKELREKTGAGMMDCKSALNETAGDLEAALARLPQEQREVLLLVGLEQMTYGESAGVLNVPIGTVMSRLSRGREKLRTLLKGEAAASSGLKVVK